MSHEYNTYLVSGSASIFMVDYSSIFTTDNRARMCYFSPLLVTKPRDNYQDEVYVSPGRITVLSTSVGNRLQFSWSIIHPFFRAMIDP